MADHSTDLPQDEAADAEVGEGTSPNGGQALEGGAYEIIRQRLEKHGSELRRRLGLLNEDRQSVFGAVEPALVATERISTSNACVPRDMAAIGGNRFLFGFNVHIGLKSTTGLEDVFGVYEYRPEDHSFHPLGVEALQRDGFDEDFAYLYKYYKEARFVKFMRIGPHLYMAFRVGRGVDDLKTFKWLVHDDALRYEGNRFDHEYRFPPQQEFEWVRAHRGMHRDGMYPHVSIEDRLFVETVGGDLTIKVEDNTDSGEGIYQEEVSHGDQTLDDAEIFYACVGSLILLKILPYQEKDYRYLVYNEKVRKVERLDAIAHSCVLLPDGHGLIFANGYHLQTGETKRFDSGLSNMRFVRRIASPNGEDYLFVFYDRISGAYVLMSYNLIDQHVDTPITCHGFTVFSNGELVYFRGEEEPQKHHVLQVWRTPYQEGEFRAEEKTDSYLFKIGNADIVRCMAECHEVLNLIGKDDSYADLYLDLAKKTGDIADSYFWVGREEVHDLQSVLREVGGAAQAAISEFDKVQRLRRSTAEESERVRDRARELSRKARNTRPDDILGFVHSLAELRGVRGEIISLRDLRYVDLEAVDALENEVADATAQVSDHCVQFLLQPEALDPYRRQVDEQGEEVDRLSKVTEAEEVEAALDAAGSELEMLIDVIGNLKIEDSTQTTQIIEDISGIYSSLNRVRVALSNRKKELARAEGEAQFGAQLKLLNQAVINYLELCETPEKCEEYLSKTMVQLEELEGRFADFDEYIDQLTEKRDEVYNAFEARKLSLVEARNRRSGSLAKSAERILNTIRHRVQGLESVHEINGYLASDLMIEKVRNVIEELQGLGDVVKADDIQTQLKTIREDAVRQLKDRQELFVDGKNVIQLGNHRFSVNTQELELTVVPHDGQMCLHLAGTRYFEPIEDEAFLATEAVWEQEVLSESPAVYRGEFLCWKILRALEEGGESLDATAEELVAFSDEALLEWVQRFMAPRYNEGYTKGVHDRDAAILLRTLLTTHLGVGLIRFSPSERAMALLFWEGWEDAAAKERLGRKLRAFGLMRKSFPGDAPQQTYIDELRLGIEAFFEKHGPACPRLHGADVESAATYLFHQLVSGQAMAVSPEAAELAKTFRHRLVSKRQEKTYDEAITGFEEDAVGRYEVIRDWLEGSSTVEDGATHADEAESAGADSSATGKAGSAAESLVASAALGQSFIAEAAVHLVRGAVELTAVQHVPTRTVLEGLAGSHPRVEGGRYRFDYLDFVQRLRDFERGEAAAFTEYTHLKTHMVEDRREAMRLDEFKPEVMSAFVRNRLLDRVYLPMIGDNLAKQIGVAGDDTRTDRMGLLLLISPPGYGKTTLMEYVANRLGITFMKINGPAIGHEVKSLDPEDAPNASAREEIRKLNLSLEMGDNVMIYLDDIQHCHPEFLQKFISLCDAQRKIEGVFRGRPRTYDLRGRKVCVVMAGNPYTESGGKFQIPDMLANRADTYNLGDIVGGHAADFESSYLENSLTSNPVLGRLATASRKDVYGVIQMAETGSQEGIDFEGNYALEELEEMVSVMRKLMRVRDTVLRVNLEYIRSAAMEDAYRTEPAFRLQGSYRNMNRMAEKVLPIMTDEEVEGLIVDHYENESQTLTTGAEANLLKFKEMENLLAEEEAERWDSIKQTFARNQLMGGAGEKDPVNRVVGSLSGVGDGLGRIEEALQQAALRAAEGPNLSETTISQLEKIIEGLRAVPVEVEIKVVPVQEGEAKESTSPKRKEAKAKKKAARKKSAAPAQPGRIATGDAELPVDIESTTRQGKERDAGDAE